MSTTQSLIDFTNRIEQKEIVSQNTAIKIRRYARTLETSTRWELFMIISGIMGALFCSAGIFSIISHNWDDYPKHIRGAFSIVPALCALYFYYRAVFHHPKSKTWVEASSVFLMLMIGASLGLVSQTYQLDGDFNKFIKVWALLTIPIFYFARSSGITFLYLSLIVVLTISINFGPFGIPRIGENDNVLWYWFLLLGFLPHYYLMLDKSSRSQSIRVVYMSYSVYFSLMLALIFTIKGNYLLWIATANVGFYLLGKRFMGENKSVFARPFQWLSQLGLTTILIGISNKGALREVFRYDSFVNWFGENETTFFGNSRSEEILGDKIFYFFFVLLVLAAIYFVFFYFRKQLKDASYLVVFTPAVIFVAMLMHEYFDTWWILSFIINAYILCLGLYALAIGSENKAVSQMAYGLGLIAVLLWIRYFDTDWNFIMKGLCFLMIGGIFFLFNVSLKGKAERIERNKNRRDEY